ncbi:MAG: hypothetical protein PHO23_02845 [Candidatus Pacebacteria bacterium]|nr:hypothetical protein [Candidatus Paceibacterota bacterium]
MGTLNHYNDEWIEIKNNLNYEINLKGFSIKSGNGKLNILIDKDLFVPSIGYALLERVDDNSVPHNKADFIYSGSLVNTGLDLYLYDSSCVLRDKVLGASG